MLQWLKRSLASFLGDKKDVVKNLPLIKKLNEKANIELDSKRSNLLKENFEEILNVVYSSDLKDYVVSNTSEKADYVIPYALSFLYTINKIELGIKDLNLVYLIKKV